MSRGIGRAETTVFYGPNWKICINNGLLPQATMEWWKHLIRVVKQAENKKAGLLSLLNWIQGDLCIRRYKELIPENDEERCMTRHIHGAGYRTPSLIRLEQFEKRLPKVVRLLEEEIKKYDMEE